MSKIATYSLADSPLQLSDRLIGTEAPRPTPSATPLATKNFSLGELLQLFSSEFPAAGLQAVLDTSNTATQDINLTGTIYSTAIKPVNIIDMLNSEGTPLQVLSKGVGGICWIDAPSGGSAIWGDITGDITNQTDLIDYLSDEYYPLSSNPAGYLVSADLSGYVPYTGATSSLNIGAYSFEASYAGYTSSLSAQTLYFLGPLGEYLSLDNGGLSINDPSGFSGLYPGALVLNNATIYRNVLTSEGFTIPDKGGAGGTFAMLSDIPSYLIPTLEQVLTEGSTATDKTIELNSASSDDVILLDAPSQTMGVVNPTTGNISAIKSTFIEVNSLSGESFRVYKDKIIRTKGSFSSNLVFTDPTANRTITFKDESGTVAYLSDIPSSSTFVPYTGATTDLDLGDKDIYVNEIFLYDAVNDNYGSTHYTDGNYHIEDADGHKLLVIEDGFMQIHKTDTIQSNLYTSLLTVIRDHYLPDASGTLALTSQIPTVDATPTDGSANAVSSNGVFDALALKQSLLGYTPYRFVNATQATYLGSVIGLAETAVAQTTILGGTFNSSDLMKILFRVTKIATSAGVNMRIKVNTTNNLGTATQIGILTLGAASTYGLINRHINLFGGNAYNYNSASTLASDVLLTNTAGTSFTYNTANDLYVFFTIQLGNVLDSATFQFANITN
jgi:hypothetical protein